MKEKEHRNAVEGTPAVQLFESQHDDLLRWAERRLRRETVRRRVVAAVLLAAVPLLSAGVIAANPVSGACGAASLSDATATVTEIFQNR